MHTVIYWIEAQATLGIAIIVLLVTYTFAAIVFWIVTILSRRPVAEELKTISPVTLTPLAVILGLLIAFLAARVWDNVNQAHEQVGREISKLSEAALLARTMPPDIAGKLRDGLKQHIAFIETQDWPAMGRFEASMKIDPVGLTNAVTALLSFTPAQPQQQLAQQRALDALANAYDARVNRIRISYVEIGEIQWMAVFVLAALIILTTGLIHIGRPRAMATTLVIFATATGICLTMLMTYDRPFAPGGITLDPAIYNQINLD
ncbi:MAG: DUF4239 domain-containing protein [Xanthobacteraceae bacterium]|nr:DUF4239 domain-containing protein [Xanthobacteraceae bacterium]